MTLKVGSLCTGVGGIELGLELTGLDFEVSWYAEVEPALVPYLAERHGPDVPNIGDITAVDWASVGPVDLLVGGIPCQPTSAAGRRLGEADPRWLWPHARTAIDTLCPARFLLENVRGLVSFDKGKLWQSMLDDLSQLGYDTRWLTLGACAVGLAHHRHRVFLLAEQSGPHGILPQRLDVEECGARRGTTLPTPTASERTGAGVATSGGNNLRTAVTLLPTPTATDAKGSRNATASRSPSARPAHGGETLTDAFWLLLPTLRASDGTKGGPNQMGRRGDLALPSAVQPERWGRFAQAVERHAQAIGAQPPDPTEPNRNGAPRLRPAFAEWMMGLPAGHVTNSLDRSPALKALGNGVVPQQLAQAWLYLTSTTGDDGVQYMGGKARIAKDLARVMLEIAPQRDVYLEPFLGGCHVLPQMAPHFDLSIATDVMPDVAILWRDALAGAFVPPTEVTREQYAGLRHAEPSALRGFVGFGCSFGGRFFEGYASNARGSDFVAPAARGIERKLSTVTASRTVIREQDYRDHEPAPGTVVYCDPPYAGTKPFSGAPLWDAEAFWATMREWVERGAVVFVSEYAAPRGWVSVWTKTANVGSLKRDGNAAPVTEHLFVHESQAPNAARLTDQLPTNYARAHGEERTPERDAKRELEASQRRGQQGSRGTQREEMGRAAPRPEERQVGPMATTEETREILEHRTQACRNAIASYVDARNDLGRPLHQPEVEYAAVAKGLHAALLAVASGWVEEAKIVERQMKRGWKSRAEGLEGMAVHLRGVAGSMLAPSIVAGLADVAGADRSELLETLAEDLGVTDSVNDPAARKSMNHFSQWQQPVSDLVDQPPLPASMLGPNQHCPECLDPGEDPRPWCDCLDGEACKAGDMCRNRVHDPLQCPTLPRILAEPGTPPCKICDHEIRGYVSTLAQCDKGCVCSTALCWPGEPALIEPDPIVSYLKGDTDVIPTATPTPAPVPQPQFIEPTAAPATAPQFVDASAGPKRLSWDEVATLAETVRLPSGGSFSTITSLAECGLAYLLDRAAKHQMDNAPRPQPAWWNVGGEAFHAGIERIERQYLLGAPVEPNDLAALWGETFSEAIKTTAEETGHNDLNLWRAANKGQENYDWWRVQGEAFLRSYLRYWDDVKRGEWEILILPDGRPALEVDLTLDVDDWPFAVRIDQAWWNRKHGFIRIVDPKSGSTKQPGTFQLGGYAHALADVLGFGHHAPDQIPKIAGAYYDARSASHDHETPDLLARHPWAEIKMRSNAAQSILSQRAFLPRVSIFGGGCSSCAHKSVCPTQGS